MKLFTVALMAAIVALALSQEPISSTTDEPTTTTTTTVEPTPSHTTTTKPTTTDAPSTTSRPKTTTPEPKTTTSRPKTTTPEPTTTTAAPPKPKDPTLGNYTLLNGEEICAYVLMKVTVTQNSTRIPFVNATLNKEASSCADERIHLWIDSNDGDSLQVDISKDHNNFYISQLAVQINSGDTAERDNLTQFSTPLSQFYKCSAASEVSLDEHDIKVIFSDMKYQAFKQTKKAEFVGSQLECVSDYHSDVIIIAIGCALALLVVVILVAYLIARRKNRQRGYQSV